ncbi:MAG: low molecular weight phosphotyrosine protein phosphatase [Flavobacteriaceae bacterium]|nr:low molecular weight phosphotyrosine protein phosphatase [Flavobacteriaceae bacterium]
MSKRILMVCLGNICRSPLAHGIIAEILPNSFVDSAGTGSYHIGSPPDPRSIQVAQDNGIDISRQSARQFQSSDFTKFDHIFVMDRQNYRDIVAKAKHQDDIDKVELLCEAAGLGMRPVPDPYYGGDEGFQNVFDLVKTACYRIAEQWKENHE